MRRFARLLTSGFMMAAVSAPAWAQQDGSLTVFYTPARSTLEVPALTGPVPGTSPPEFVFDNDAHYGGVFGDAILIGRVGVMGGIKFGRSNTIPGGAEFTPQGLPGPNFNPTTNESARILDVAASFALVKTMSARVDATAGYFYLHAKPEISKANSYGGPSFGFRTKYVFDNGIDVHGNLSLVPAFFVHGNVEKSLDDDSIIQYRLGADYSIVEHFGVSAGFDGFKLSGKAKPGNPLIQFFGDNAVVNLYGFYFGGQVKW